MSTNLTEWTETQKYNTGIGVALDEKYPLSTYKPISSQQLDILTAQYYIKKNLDASELANLQSKLFEYDENESAFTFNELFPSKYHFAQKIADKSGFFKNNFNLDAYPGQKYYYMSIFQEAMLDKEYLNQKSINKYYSEDDLSNFCKKIESQAIMPKEYLNYFEITEDGVIYM